VRDAMRRVASKMQIPDLKKDFTLAIVTRNMQQAARIFDDMAFFHLGGWIGYDATNKLFANPAHKQAEDYGTGRSG
jgi:phosphate transport system ATP-binding protein